MARSVSQLDIQKARHRLTLRAASLWLNRPPFLAAEAEDQVLSEPVPMHQAPSHIRVILALVAKISP